LCINFFLFCSHIRKRIGSHFLGCLVHAVLCGNVFPFSGWNVIKVIFVKKRTFCFHNFAESVHNCWIVVHLSVLGRNTILSMNKMCLTISRSLEQSSAWESESHSACQIFSKFVGIWMFITVFHQGPSLVPALSHTTSVHTTPSYYFKMYVGYICLYECLPSGHFPSYLPTEIL
jgi:hypothetical protein